LVREVKVFHAGEAMPETITDYIKRDLRARARGNGGLPENLTLSALSEQYRVSLTPVRLAVRDLVAEQVLLKYPNGRLAINRNKTQPRQVRPAPAPVPPPGLSELESRLADQIIRASLRGEAIFLREETTAEQLGVGRTVLRQVFSRLAGKGLLEHLPRRGWRVRPFDEADMRAYLEVRVSLELKALHQARPCLVRAELEAMLRGNRPGGKTDGPRLDNRLHRYLIDKADNPYVRDFFDRHGLYFTTLFDYAAPEAHVVAAMARQHRVILRALIAGDWPRARKALAHHIRSQRPVLERLLRGLGREKARGGRP
jgi:DNA-binding GntR family transcriptional regulator